MKNLRNHLYTGARNKKGLIDLFLPDHFSGKLILFVHGYMGYKDWGAWNLVQDYFTQLGFGFCKYSITHGGTNEENPCSFVEEELFSQNCYSYELADFYSVLDWLEKTVQPLPEIYLIGHSRGGGIAILGSSDNRVSKVVTWAGICSIADRFPLGEELEEWESKTIRYQFNSRTLQNLPLHYSQYEDFLSNVESLDIEKIVRKNTKPTLHFHGDADNSVKLEEGKRLSNWSKTELQIIFGANHTFGSSEPWKENYLPENLLELCKRTAAFFLLSKQYGQH